MENELTQVYVHVDHTGNGQLNYEVYSIEDGRIDYEFPLTTIIDGYDALVQYLSDNRLQPIG